MLIQSGEKMHKCAERTKSFSHTGNLRKHMLTHTLERKCRNFRFRFGKWWNLKSSCTAVDHFYISVQYNFSVTGEKPILCFETRSRIVFFQSRASRRERDFVHRISSLKTRSRILFTESRALRRDREFCSSNLEIRDEIEIF